VSVDDEIERYSRALKQLREKRESILQNIKTEIDNKNLSDVEIQIKDKGSLQLYHYNQYQPLTYKYLEECMNNYFSLSTEEIKQFINYLKRKRHIERKFNIRKKF